MNAWRVFYEYILDFYSRRVNRSMCHELLQRGQHKISVYASDSYVV